MSLKCWTAPGVEFGSRDELHEHYKSEWHKYNLKRKVGNLAPIPRAMFDKLQLIAAEREREKTSKSKGVSHLKRGKARSGSVSTGASSAAPPAAPGAAAHSTEQEDQEGGPREYEIDTVELKKSVDERVSFMDGHVSGDLSETLVYLHKKFGFFVPDAEFCVDLPGLFKYCTKKVRAGRMCLYCGKGFHNAESAVQHMVAKSHCKLPWEEEEDLEEFDEFFDYSALSSSESEGAVTDADADANADADVDMEAGTGAMGDRGGNSSHGKKVELMSTGELLFTNSKTGERKIIGHRAFRLTYKQKVYNTEETRPAFLAGSNERLLLAYKRAGVETASALTKPVQINGGRPLWMTKKLAQHQRRAIYFDKKMNLRDGMQINLQIKNLQHRTKNMGAGFGVHG